MSEFTSRPLWQVPAAILGSVAMIAAATNIRAGMDKEIKENPALDSSMPSEAVPTTILETPTTTTIKKYIGPPEQLEEGFLVDGIGLRFQAKYSRGVDCQKSYQADASNHSTENNEAKTSRVLPQSSSLLKMARNIMFFGEETSKPRLGNNKLSHGWAIENKPNSSDYTVYEFSVKPSGILRAEAIGRPFKVLTPSDLQDGGYRTENETMIFTAEINESLAEQEEEHISLAITCKNKQQTEE